jgi:hypothetical protein
MGITLSDAKEHPRGYAVKDDPQASLACGFRKNDLAREALTPGRPDRVMH